MENSKKIKLNHVLLSIVTSEVFLRVSVNNFKMFQTVSSQLVHNGKGNNQYLIGLNNSENLFIRPILTNIKVHNWHCGPFQTKQLDLGHRQHFPANSLILNPNSATLFRIFKIKLIVVICEDISFAQSQ